MKKIFGLVAFIVVVGFSSEAKETPFGLEINHGELLNLTSISLDVQDNLQLVAQAEEIERHGGRTNHGKMLSAVGVDELNSGTWTLLENGDKVWQLRMHSSGALAISVFFNNLYLPQGSSLFVYPTDQSYFEGPFLLSDCAAHGYFATPEVLGDDVVLEYYEPAGVVAKTNIQLRGIGHYYRFIYDYRDMRGAASDFCEVDVNCPEGGEWTAERDAAVRLQLTDGGDIFLCSGSLVNTTEMDCRKYILTAFHCVEGISNADLLLASVRFNYERDGCGTGSAPTRNKAGVVKHADSNDGGGNNGSDFALLEMEDAIPSAWTPYFAGWDASSGTPVSGVSIHHPNGDVKKISTTEDVISGTWGAPGFHWRVEWMETETEWGVTEGGSSGSPLYNQNHHIVGQLTGGGSFCTQPTANDYYGKMSKNWSANPNPSDEKLKEWLDPTNQSNNGAIAMFGSYVNTNLSLPCSINTAVEEQQMKFDDVAIYPTIAQGDITITTAGFRDMKEVRIYDSAGALVEVFALKDVQNIFKLSHYSAGLYYMTFLHINGSQLTKKFTVAK
ncbi:MAG: trypsin-like peptidase domain-containing protein [Flavobacteriales bacterium]